MHPIYGLGQEPRRAKTAEGIVAHAGTGSEDREPGESPQI